MEKLKIGLVMFALVVFSGAASATGNLSVNIIPGKSDRAEIKISNSVQSYFEIEITDASGDVVFYKKTKTPSTSYNKLYDFSMLENGRYNFLVKLNDEMEQNTLDITNGVVKVVSERKDVKPFFTFSNKELKLSYLNFAKDDVRFFLYDTTTNELVLEKNLNSEFAINYGLDFSKIKKGNYSVVLIDATNIYEYNVSID